MCREVAVTRQRRNLVHAVPSRPFAEPQLVFGAGSAPSDLSAENAADV
jgi:hypothetical protein